MSKQTRDRSDTMHGQAQGHLMKAGRNAVTAQMAYCTPPFTGRSPNTGRVTIVCAIAIVAIMLRSAVFAGSSGNAEQFVTVEGTIRGDNCTPVTSPDTP